MRILVTDDDFVGRAKIAAILEKFGRCTVASNGKLALRLFERAHTDNEPFDLITMDIDMPDIKGQEVVHRIRSWELRNLSDSQNGAVRILMVTAMRDTKNTLTSFKEGCESYLVKPVSPDRLAVALLELGFDVGNRDA